MSFLDRIGKAALTGLRYAAPFFGTLASEDVGTPLQTIAGLVMAAEAIGTAVEQRGGSKVDKLAMVHPEAKSALLASPLLQGKDITDPAGLDQATTAIINGVVQLLKSVDTKQPQDLPEKAAASGNQPSTH